MSKAKNDHTNQKVQGHISQKDKPRLIFIGENELMTKKVQNFATENKMFFHHYSEEDWATLEEIDQYIQEEEFSKQVVNLPVGKTDLTSLSEMEAATIKKTLKHVNGNMMKAARKLKIARATLYRKIEMYGLKVKKQREQDYHNRRNIKKAA